MEIQDAMRIIEQFCDDHSGPDGFAQDDPVQEALAQVMEFVSEKEGI
ncbi:hypothetical protein LCGC14_1369560 [marine sediment metagenome]|uniref:Uncharacterized protein n=1 Tax=marine sediment metagenome TaxID=412755 RepID=A0A0F9K660_9ZZZZ